MKNTEIGDQILVTGGAGYIGSHVVYALRDRGINVVVLDNLSTGRKESLPEDIIFAEGNAGDILFVQKLIKQYSITNVMHFAGSIIVPDSVKDPLGYYQNNTEVSRSLISACISSGVANFVFSSTAAVYGQANKMPVDETVSPNPESPYGRSKLMTEWMLDDVSNSTDLNYVALRYFNVAGADPKGRTGQCNPKATHLLQVANEVATGKRSELIIFGEDYNTPDGSCIRDYIHVSDLAEAHVEVLFLLLNTKDNFVLNCGYGRGNSVKEVVSEYINTTGKNIAYRIGARRDGDVAELVSDPSRLKNLTDWTPKHTELKDAIATSLSWEMQMDNLN